MEDKLNTLLTAPSENELLEFKEAKNQFDFDKLGKYFCALCNEANLKHKAAAWLVMGVRDRDRAIVGTRYKSQVSDLHGLKAAIANHTTGRISFTEIHEVNHSEGRVLLFEIPPAPQGIPVAWKGHYYARDHEELQPLNIEKLERIRNQALLKDWSAMICEDASLSDLSPEAILKARQVFVTKNPALASDIENWDDMTFLNKAKVCIQGKVTHTAILLLGKPESDHFINPASTTISWILRDRDNLEKDYSHFGCPLILSVDKVFQKIRNLKYRYFPEESLFPEEVDRYDPFIIREALNNCIAHQDYTLGGSIQIVEYEDDKLIFQNMGAFIPQSIEKVLISDAPEPKNRNRFLTSAMVNLNMIDTIGSGIKRMFTIQKNKYFPLPDYDLSDNKVKVTIIGKVLDINYARKLAQMPGLGLSEILLLDKVQKGKNLTDEEVRELRNKKLVEGRKPNLHVSSKVAKTTGQKEDYIKLRRFKDDHYKQMILKYLDKYTSATKQDIDKLILDILPNVLEKKQKENKIRNILYAMSKKDQTIANHGTRRKPVWKKV